MDAETLSTVKTLGLPTVFCLLLLWGGFKLGKLFILAVCVPVGNKHIQYLDSSLKVIDKIAERLDDGICRAPPHPPGPTTIDVHPSP